MRFPSAHEGVKLILISQIIGAIDVVLLPVCAFVLQLAMANKDRLLGVIILVLLVVLAALILSVCALVLQFVGLHRAGADEQRFRAAMTCAIVSLCVGLALSVGVGLATGLATAFGSDAALSSKLSSVMLALVAVVGGVLSCGIMHYIASGVRNLARKLGDEPMAAGCTRFQRTIAVFYGLTILISIASALIRSGGTPNTLISAISLAVSLGSAVVIIEFLNRAKNMLAQ